MRQSLTRSRRGHSWEHLTHQEARVGRAPRGVPVSCKAAVSCRCCTPFSISSSSLLMLVTTSPSRPTSAMPFQKVSVSSAGTETDHFLPRRRDLRGSSASLSHLRSRLIPSCPQTPASSSPASRSECRPCLRPPRRRSPGPPELRVRERRF